MLYDFKYTKWGFHTKYKFELQQYANHISKSELHNILSLPQIIYIIWYLET